MIHAIYGSTYKDLQKENKQLQEKIDKAIEYINKTQMPEGYKKMLLIILGDKENE